MTDRDELEFLIAQAKGRGDRIEVRHTPEGYIDAIAWGAASCWWSPLSFAEKARPVFGRFRR